MRGHISKVGLGILIASLLVVPSLAMTMHARGEGESTVPWTVAIYVNGDNDLERYWEEYSRPALENIPASSGLNVVAMMDWVAQNGTMLYEISGGEVTLAGTYEEKNYGDGATFQWFLTEVSTLYPSEKLAVIGWDHGYAWRYFSNDQTSGDKITMPELQAAIEGAGVSVDILGFDACNMAAIEVVWQVSLTGLVDILVGSEETIPMNGFPYDLMFTSVADDPSRTPTQVATDMVDGWAAYYDPLTWAQSVGLSATDVQSIGQQSSAFVDWAAAMHANLGSYAREYKKAIRDTYSAYATNKHLDMADLGDNILANSKISNAALRTATAAIVTAIDSSVIASCTGDWASACRGLTIWWGLTSDWDYSGPAYLVEVAFAIDTGWGAFLEDYN
ncbi:MAG: clostripain-related cysteine peptidase [Thermoplasmata archaeon]|nr:clostripain-related cysteine peptidase [Thermoplasmata archaeon]